MVSGISVSWSVHELQVQSLLPGSILMAAEEAQGPVTVIRKVMSRAIFPQYDDDGIRTSTVPAKDMAGGCRSADRRRGPTGDKGTVLALNCRTVHGSKRG